MALSAALLAEISTSSPRIFRLMEVDYPSPIGTVGYSDGSVRMASPSGFSGLYRPLMRTWGQWPRVPSDRSGAMPVYGGSLTFNDADGHFAGILGSGYFLPGCAVRCYIGSPNVLTSEWEQFFGGVIRGWSADDFGYTLEVRTDDSILDADLLRKHVDVTDWPNMPKDGIGALYPHIYGKHADYGFWSTGQIPCISVDPTAGTGEYLVALGWVNPIRVFFNKVLKVPTTDYTVQHKLVNGWYVTTIKGVTALTEPVTCDCDGYETVGDGTGSLISDPGDILAHLISNFAKNDYNRGNWFATASTVIDTASFAALKTALSTRASGSAYKGARRYDQPTKLREAIESWAFGHEVRVLWTPTGKLAVELDSPNVQAGTAGVYLDSALIREEDLIEPPGISYESDPLQSRFLYRYDVMQNGGQGLDNSHPAPKTNDMFEAVEPIALARVIGSGDGVYEWGPATQP